MQKGFMTLNAATGKSRIHLATNAPPKPTGCTCGRCGARSTPSRQRKDPPTKPFDREDAVRHARQLDERARNATTDRERRTWEHRALLVWDLVEVEDRERARQDAGRIGTTWKPNTILGRGSVLDSK